MATETQKKIVVYMHHTAILNGPSSSDHMMNKQHKEIVAEQRAELDICGLPRKSLTSVHNSPAV